ncbi:MAG: DUF1592 domain-containing protein [Acidobacteria bacterium]|nr:DUF1592 domain-containing protein [Acidobacteriota bacterium]
MRLIAILFSLAAASGQDVFFSKYCVQCHGAKVQMANRRFDQLQFPLRDADSLQLLQDTVDRLNLGTMPPRGAAQPAPDEKLAAIESFTKAIAGGHARRVSTGGKTVLRRLNKREYLNTIGDLFAMNMSMFDPASYFPRDQVSGNMDNIGDALVTSGYLLEQYMAAAERVVEKAFRVTERPAPREWSFTGPFRQQPEVDYAHRFVWNQQFMVLYETPRTVYEEGAYGPLYAFAEGVPADGVYEVSVLAEAVNRHHPYDAKLFGMFPDEPFRMGMVSGDARVGALHHEQPLQPRMGEVIVKDNVREWYSFRGWFDAGFSPRFTFPNGNADGRGSFNRILNKYRHLLPEDQRNFPPGIRPARPHLLTHGFLPQIRIHEVHIRGPIVDQWPPKGHQQILGGTPREVIERFAARAYRRKPAAAEIDRILAIVDRRRTEGRSQFDALKDGMKAVLCSPAFLYLDPADIASRLSYFLWSTMPDEELLRTDLSKPAARAAQLRRMLSSPNSDRFVQDFLDSWLNLRGLGDMPPNRDSFGVFYTEDLQHAMKVETRMFTRHLLDKNLPIANFLDSDFTFANNALARLYGIPGQFDEKFRQVRLDDKRRGGLLGQGSVLTVSANGIETSPVTRGVWVLENILGTPPSPPPDNVPTIDPDVRGAKSVRDLLVKHRENETCMACHAKIDPPGFALENFDPIGRWRTNYEKGATIDPSGELPGGHKFADVVEFKKALVERQPLFAKALTEKLLTYSTGRRMEAGDRPEIDRIVSELVKRGGGFRDLLELVVMSRAFTGQ